MARIGDAGPIAWRSVAARIDAPRAGIAQLRLEFLPDNWMIDWAGVSFDGGADAELRTVPPAHVECGGRADGRRVADLVAKEDDRYLVTVPGDRLTFEYRPGAVPAGMTRSYFVGTRGYYIEWLRSTWLKQWQLAEREYPFTLSDASITRAARLWQEKKADFERQFFGTRFDGKAGVR
ncbi:MAG: hypothetical protein IPP94_18775 [Ignavibacteria bacterium]|nr:hypothetical protein [Ignavibacteria bacterium]